MSLFCWFFVYYVAYFNQGFAQADAACKALFDILSGVRG